MLTIEKLEKFGANTEEGLARCLNNEELYLKLTGTIPAEERFDVLKESVENDDLHAAFEAAHALKGVLGNLSLTALYQPVVEITELLRAETRMDYSALLEQISAKREELRSICEE